MTLTHGQRLHPVLRLQQGAVTEPADLVHQRLALERVVFHHHDHQLMLCLVHRAIIHFACNRVHQRQYRLTQLGKFVQLLEAGRRFEPGRLLRQSLLPHHAGSPLMRCAVSTRA